jgi:hypothetical protein
VNAKLLWIAALSATQILTTLGRPVSAQGNVPKPRPESPSQTVPQPRLGQKERGLPLEGRSQLTNGAFGNSAYQSYHVWLYVPGIYGQEGTLSLEPGYWGFGGQPYGNILPHGGGLQSNGWLYYYADVYIPGYGYWRTIIHYLYGHATFVPGSPYRGRPIRREDAVPIQRSPSRNPS